MLIVVGPHHSVDWKYTRNVFVWDYPDYVKLRKITNPQIIGKRNFGAGDEDTFICLKCQRKLPVAIAEVDHKIPKSNIGIKESTDLTQKEIRKTSTRSRKFYSIPRSGNIQVIIYSQLDRSLKEYTFICYKESGEYKIEIDLSGKTEKYDLKHILSNDMDNLQLLCGYCNKSKGSR